MRELLAAGAILVLLSGCSAKTQIGSADPGARVLIKASNNGGTPRTGTFSTTSFGNYEFKATADSGEPLFGIVPLKFNGGYLVIDILLFAPGLFFNLREVYPFYDFSVGEGMVRFRKKESDPWNEYRPTPEEAERSRKHFKEAGSEGSELKLR